MVRNDRQPAPMPGIHNSFAAIYYLFAAINSKLLFYDHSVCAPVHLVATFDIPENGARQMHSNVLRAYDASARRHLCPSHSHFESIFNEVLHVPSLRCRSEIAISTSHVSKANFLRKLYEIYCFHHVLKIVKRQGGRGDERQKVVSVDKR